MPQEEGDLRPLGQMAICGHEGTRKGDRIEEIFPERVCPCRGKKKKKSDYPKEEGKKTVFGDVGGQGKGHRA